MFWRTEWAKWPPIPPPILFFENFHFNLKIYIYTLFCCNRMHFVWFHCPLARVFRLIDSAIGSADDWKSDVLALMYIWTFYACYLATTAQRLTSVLRFALAKSLVEQKNHQKGQIDQFGHFLAVHWWIRRDFWIVCNHICIFSWFCMHFLVMIPLIHRGCMYLYCSRTNLLLLAQVSCFLEAFLWVYMIFFLDFLRVLMNFQTSHQLWSK